MSLNSSDYQQIKQHITVVCNPQNMVIVSMITSLFWKQKYARLTVHKSPCPIKTTKNQLRCNGPQVTVQRSTSRRVQLNNRQWKASHNQYRKSITFKFVSITQPSYKIWRAVSQNDVQFWCINVPFLHTHLGQVSNISVSMTVTYSSLCLTSRCFLILDVL